MEEARRIAKNGRSHDASQTSRSGPVDLDALAGAARTLAEREHSRLLYQPVIGAIQRRSHGDTEVRWKRLSKLLS